MNDAENFIFIIDNGEIGKTGFIEFIKNKRAEDFGVFDKNHVFFRDHEVSYRAVVKTHDGSDAVAIFGA